VTDHLGAEARVLIAFGTTGDIDYLHHLIAQSGLRREELRSVKGEKDGLAVAYFAYRLRFLSRSPGSSRGRGR
jgi:hypothetical protein